MVISGVKGLASSNNSRYIVPESTNELYYPKSKHRVKLDSKGSIISDTAKDRDTKGDNNNEREYSATRL